MPDVDPHMAEILRLINGLDLPPYESMSGAEARAAAEERNLFWNEGNPEVGPRPRPEHPWPGRRRCACGSTSQPEPTPPRLASSTSMAVAG